jgi:hypothetical protein
MKKIKIRIIDEKKRGDDIYSAIRGYNILSKEEALRPDEEVFDKPELSPEIFLLHITDIKKQGKPSYDYLKRINSDLKDALIVLYSGGTLKIEKQSEKRIKFTDDNDTWDFEVSDGHRFCIVEKPVNSLSDIPIEQALENYLAADKDKDIFFEILKYQGSEHIAALDILCQGYLMAGMAAGKIDKNDKDEVIALIGWSDKIKEIFPKAESDWEDGWEKVKNPQWWDIVGDIQDIKDQIRREMQVIKKTKGNLSNSIEILIDLIINEKKIEDYKVVKNALKNLRGTNDS